MKEYFRKFFNRRRLICWGICFSLLILMYLFRFPIMRAMGNFLIHEDRLENCDAVFVLGGASLERGIEAKKIFDAGYSKNFITTGENIPTLLKAIDTLITEAEITAMYLVKNGIPAEYVKALKMGTSTREEARAILQYCQTHQYKKIMILSTRFHTRRVYYEFKNAFTESGILVMVHGAPSVVYKEEEWWKYEEGMIMLNNEYMKMLYYILK